VCRPFFTLAIPRGRIRDLAIDAHPAAANVRQFAIDAPPAVSNVRQSALSRTIPGSLKFAVHDIPGTLPAAPPTTNPQTTAPTPPARRLRIEPVGIALQLPRYILAFTHEPRVPGVKITLTYRPVRPMCDGVRVHHDSAPEIGQQPIRIVHCFCADMVIAGACQQHCAASEERLNIIWHVSESFPDHRSNQ
jgi:hypothetical protein